MLALNLFVNMVVTLCKGFCYLGLGEKQTQFQKFPKKELIQERYRKSKGFSFKCSFVNLPMFLGKCQNI